MSEDADDLRSNYEYMQELFRKWWRMHDVLDAIDREEREKFYHSKEIVKAIAGNRIDSQGWGAHLERTSYMIN